MNGDLLNAYLGSISFIFCHIQWSSGNMLATGPKVCGFKPSQG
jgi:hypothetical protein